MKATRKVTFQVRIYLRRNTARRSGHEQNQTRHRSKIKLFQHGRPPSRGAERDIRALWSTNPKVCKRVISHCLQKFLYANPSSVHFIFKSSIGASKKDSCQCKLLKNLCLNSFCSSHFKNNETKHQEWRDPYRVDGNSLCLGGCSSSARQGHCINSSSAHPPQKSSSSN